MSSEGVTEEVAGDSSAARRVWVLDAGPRASVRHDVVDLPRREGTVPVGEEDGARGTTTDEEAQVAGELLGDGDGALLSALTDPDGDASRQEVQVSHVQCGDFCAAHPRRGEGRKQGSVPRVVAGVDHLADFSGFQGKLAVLELAPRARLRLSFNP